MTLIFYIGNSSFGIPVNLFWQIAHRSLTASALRRVPLAKRDEIPRSEFLIGKIRKSIGLKFKCFQPTIIPGIVFFDKLVVFKPDSHSVQFLILTVYFVVFGFPALELFAEGGWSVVEGVEGYEREKQESC